jgi:hypothetical protein
MYFRGESRLTSVMRTPAPLALTALLTAVALMAGVSTAAAADEKPAPRETVKTFAVDAEASAAAARIEAQGSALGSYWDPERAELAVVVGPDSELDEESVKRLVGGPYRLERLEIARKTADSIRSDIAAREFAPEAAKYSYSSHLDLQTGRVVLRTDAPASVTERLVKEHPEIELREDKAVQDLFHRRDDIPSFWGGAAIRSGGGTCSTGFTVKKPSGARMITTAAHCFGVGSIVRTPPGTFVGSVVQRGTLGSIWFWDNRDVELIGGSSYAPRVYTGGVFSTSSRGVVGAGDPVAGFRGYCSSGQTSGEQCNQKVESTGAIVCTQTGCKWPVIEYTGGPANPGDSGGSFYLPSGSASAFARGAVIAGNGVTSYAEPWSRISSSMGVSIAT